MGEKSKMNIKPIYMYISLCSRALIIFVLPCLHVKCTFNLKSHYNICLDMQVFKNLFAIFIFFQSFHDYGGEPFQDFRLICFLWCCIDFQVNHLTNYQLHCHFPIVQIKIASFCTFTAFDVVHEFSNARITNLRS